MTPGQRRVATGAAAAAAGLAALAGSAHGGDWRLALMETGRRDYYCVARLRLENRGPQPIEEVNGHLLVVVDGAPVGRSRGASFLDVAPGGRAEAAFETPNAPCERAALTFVVGACRIGGVFVAQADCAARLDPEAPLTPALPR